MTTTSSARYTDLYDYARTAERIDHDLINQADRLTNRLSYFEATCREPGFQVSSDGLGSALRSYGVHALPVDGRVRTVGEGFQRADRSPLRLWRMANRIPRDYILRSVDYLMTRPIVFRALQSADGPTRENANSAWTAISSFGTLALVSTLRTSKSVYPGRVGLSAMKPVRRFLNLKATHLKATTLKSHLIKPSLTFALVDAGFQSWAQWDFNAQAFEDSAERKTANVYDTTIIVTKSLVVAVGAAAIVASLPVTGPVAVGVAVVSVSLVLSELANRFILEPYLEGDQHKKHVEILTLNLQELKRNPLEFTKVLGEGVVERLSLNAEEFARQPVVFTQVFADEYLKAIDKQFEVNENLSKMSEQIKSGADQLVKFITGDTNPPPPCVVWQ
jgi:hypothetical protein